MPGKQTAVSTAAGIGHLLQVGNITIDRKQSRHLRERTARYVRVSYKRLRK